MDHTIAHEMTHAVMDVNIKRYLQIDWDSLRVSARNIWRKRIRFSFTERRDRDGDARRFFLRQPLYSSLQSESEWC